MIAVKGNRVYRIDEGEKEARREEGFDIFDDKGKMLAPAKNKTVPYDKYAALETENAKLKKQIKELKKGEMPGETGETSAGKE